MTAEASSDRREFLALLWRLGLPVALQEMVATLVALYTVVILGRLGETQVAAAALANQVFFLLALLLFGTSSGATVFSAQFWGKGDVRSIRRVLSLILSLNLTSAAVFSLIVMSSATRVLSLLSPDPAVIQAGASYIRIVALSYFASAITFSLAATLRSIGNTRLPMVTSAGSLLLHAVLSFGLVMGRWGLPTLGLMGVAVSLCCVRWLECAALLALVYGQQSPAAASWAELRSLDRQLVRRVLSTSLPVMLGELVWALAMTMFNRTYAFIGTDAIAAANFVSTVESAALVPFVGMMFAGATIIGNSIGANQEKRATGYGRWLLGLSVAFALALGLGLFFGRDLLLANYGVAPATLAHARRMLAFAAGLLTARGLNMILFIAILRAGGDTRFCFWLDVTATWVVGVLPAYLGATVFRLPVEWVYLLAMGNEVVKAVACLLRFRSGRWLRNLVRQ